MGFLMDEQSKKQLSVRKLSVRTVLQHPVIVQYGYLLLLLIPLLLAGFLRWYPMTLPFTQVMAEDIIEDKLQQTALTAVSNQYLNLPPQNKQVLIQQEIARFKAQHSEEYQAAIRGERRKIEAEFRDAQDVAYLGDIDTYLYYLRAERLIRTGNLGTTIVDGKPYDTATLAPIGEPVDSNLHYYVIAGLYALVHLIDDSVNLKTVIAIIPILISMLAVIPAFFLGRRLGGNIGAFAAAMIVATQPFLLSRTLGGLSDTEAYAIFFPLLVLWLFYEATQASRSTGLLLAACAGLAIGLFAFTWSGWWYIFDFILIGTVVSVLYKRVVGITEGKKWDIHLLTICAVFIAAAGIAVSGFVSFTEFRLSPLTYPLNFFTFKQAPNSLWFNVYTSVAELSSLSTALILTTIGKMLLFLSALGLLFLFPASSKMRIVSAVWVFIITFALQSLSILWFIILLLVPLLVLCILSIIQRIPPVTFLAFTLPLWLAGMIYAASQGIRFTSFIIPPLALTTAIAVGKLYPTLTERCAKWLHVRRKFVAIIIVALLVSPIGLTAYKGFAAVTTPQKFFLYPTDAWWNALGMLQRAAPDAIITSWWDYGHWYKVMSGRAVTFDGGNQNAQLAYWVGRMFMVQDEKEALGILRMLDCGSDQAQRIVEEQFGTIRAADILNQLVTSNSAQAQQLLAEEGVEPNLRQRILQYTHCIPPEAYVVVSEDMLATAEAAWGHFGSWDFRKAKMMQARQMDEQSGLAFLRQMNLSEGEALAIYSKLQTLQFDDPLAWIAPFPSYRKSVLESCEQNTIITCRFRTLNNAVVKFDPQTQEARVEKDGVVFSPAAFVFASNDSYIVKAAQGDRVLPQAIAFMQTGNDVYGLSFSPQLVNTMFTRLFLYLGYGTEYFQLFSRERDIYGYDILVWKVDWEAYLRDMGEQANRKHEQNTEIF